MCVLTLILCQAITWFAQGAATIAAIAITVELLYQTRSVRQQPQAQPQYTPTVIDNYSKERRHAGSSNHCTVLCLILAVFAASQAPPQRWFKNRDFAKVNCATAAALLAGIMAMLGVLALRALALARQQKHWTQRRWRLASIHVVQLLVQVSSALAQREPRDPSPLKLERLTLALMHKPG